MEKKELSPIEEKFLRIYFDPELGAGNATKTASLVWPKRYKNYKENPKIYNQAERIGSYWIKKLNPSLKEAFDALGFTTFAKAQKGLEFLEAKKTVLKRNKEGELEENEVNDYYVQHKAYETILRFTEKETLRHEIPTQEVAPIVLEHTIKGLNLKGNFKELALQMGLKLEEVSSEAIDVTKKSDDKKITSKNKKRKSRKTIKKNS